MLLVLQFYYYHNLIKYMCQKLLTFLHFCYYLDKELRCFLAIHQQEYLVKEKLLVYYLVDKNYQQKNHFEYAQKIFKTQDEMIKKARQFANNQYSKLVCYYSQKKMNQNGNL
ncbi:unnamed protein product [Paramecium sonneborni]|uniref:Uncharacterized protein n=1 Tax=Paramecium sonneborni TaxID=65129 RepID=A0A8S1MY66_9CILI|nr:unnamed protein product [Paramecium sonneborni]